MSLDMDIRYLVDLICPGVKVIENAGSNLRGYYDFERRLISLRDMSNNPYSQLVAAHEAFHAFRHRQNPGLSVYSRQTTWREREEEETIVDSYAFEMCAILFPENIDEYVDIMEDKYENLEEFCGLWREKANALTCKN